MSSEIVCTAGRVSRRATLISRDVMRIGSGENSEVVVHDDASVPTLSVTVEYVQSRQQYIVRNATQQSAKLAGEPFPIRRRTVWEPGEELQLTPRTSFTLQVEGDPAPTAEVAPPVLETAIEEGQALKQSSVRLILLSVVAVFVVGGFITLVTLDPLSEKTTDVVDTNTEETSLDLRLASGKNPILKEQWTWLQYAHSLHRRGQIGPSGRATKLYNEISRRLRRLIAEGELSDADLNIAREMIDLTSEREQKAKQS